jgi:DNA-binding CsgD family transcriptional regulator
MSLRENIPGGIERAVGFRRRQTGKGQRLDQGFAAWNSALAGAMKAVGTESFGQSLAAALATIIDFDVLMVFAYRGAEKPVCCYHNIDPKRARTIIDAYTAGPYLLDPFYGAALDTKKTSILRLKDMAPDHFYSSEYYRQHYVLTGIRDEVGILCRTPNWTGIVISFTRPVTAPAFGRRDLSLIRGAEPVLRTICERHWSVVGSATGAGPVPGHDPINDTLNRMTNGVLTPREIEVTSLILRGHSNASIAATLKITSGTVKIHRKNIHQKLNITSQAELFGLFIRKLAKL